MRRKLITLLMLIAPLTVCASAIAQPTTQPDRPRPGAGGGPGTIVDRIQQFAGDLKLSDEQKSKFEDILGKARDELREIMPTLRDMAPEERQMRVRDFVKDLREKIAPILSDEQRAAFEQKLQNVRGAGGPNAARAGATQPTTRPSNNAGGAGLGGAMQRMRDAVAKLDMSDDQKAKIQQHFADAEAKFRELRAQAAGDAQALREKARPVLEQLRTSIRETLSPEQQQQLRELINSRNNNGDRPANPGRPNPERPNRERRPDGTGDDSKSMQKPDSPNANSPATQPKGEEPKASSSGGGAMAPPVLQPGQPAPALALKKLDGSPVQLSSLKGKITLLAFGSYTSPSFRQRAETLEQLRKDFNTRVSFIIVYTKEAHPSGSWEVERNRDAEIAVAQQKDESDRKRYAREAVARLGIGGAMIAVDSMDDATATAYRAYPNNAAVLIGKDGNVLAYQEWFDAYRMRDEILAALSERK